MSVRLTPDQVAAARYAHAQGAPSRVVARRLGVPEWTLRHALERRTWREHDAEGMPVPGRPGRPVKYGSATWAERAQMTLGVEIERGRERCETVTQ